MVLVCMVAEDKRESLSDVQPLAQSPRARINHEVRHRRTENRSDDEIDNLY